MSVMFIINETEAAKMYKLQYATQVRSGSRVVVRP